MIRALKVYICHEDKGFEKRHKNQTDRCESILATLAGVQPFDSFYPTCHCDGSVAFLGALLKLLAAVSQTINTIFQYSFPRSDQGQT